MASCWVCRSRSGTWPQEGFVAGAVVRQRTECVTSGAEELAKTREGREICDREKGGGIIRASACTRFKGEAELKYLAVRWRVRKLRRRELLVIRNGKTERDLTGLKNESRRPV